MDPLDPMQTAIAVQAIQELRERDIAAAKSKDLVKLTELWAKDAVLIPPGGCALKTEAERNAYLRSAIEGMKGLEILDYREDFQALAIRGDEAMEWGTIQGSVLDPGSGKVTESVMNILRLLKRQENGEWKIALSIFNEGSPSPE